RQAVNLDAVVNTGRQPDLRINNGSGNVPLPQWARQLLEAMRPIAALLDATHESSDYSISLEHQLAKVADPELTPSARMLREMRDRKLSFFGLAMAYSEQWAQYFRERPPAADVQRAFEDETRLSLRAQKAIEESDNVSFEQYLHNFFVQYTSLYGHWL
ncbi:MAG TPA: glutamate--cysteine ligase, partial [Halioglobus sp.]